MGFVVATYAVYEADIEEFVSYYKGQGVSRICVYVGRSYIPVSLPQGNDIEYVAWSGDPEAKAVADAQTRFGGTGDWYAWIALNERYYIARNITMAEYLETVTPSFGAVRVQAHLARAKGESGEIEYCKEGLPWTPGDKAGLIRRNAEPTLDSGVAKKLHILSGQEAEKLTGTLYTVPISKS